jgi:hypothetical protein
MRTFIVLLFAFLPPFTFAQGSCPAPQAQRLTHWLTSPPNPVPPEKQKVVPTRAQLEQVCLPGGQKAYLVAHGVQPPKIEQGGFPTANGSALASMGVGQHWVVLRASESGVVTAAYIVTENNSLAQEVTDGFRGWKLKPATFKGAAVPVVFKVQLEFKPAQ